jgi:hypothetical protein
VLFEKRPILGLVPQVLELALQRLNHLGIALGMERSWLNTLGELLPGNADAAALRLSRVISPSRLRIASLRRGRLSISLTTRIVRSNSSLCPMGSAATRCNADQVKRPSWRNGCNRPKDFSRPSPSGCPLMWHPGAKGFARGVWVLQRPVMQYG